MDLVSEFRHGAFGIRRTKANFAKSPVYLTLEQTSMQMLAINSLIILLLTQYQRAKDGRSATAWERRYCRV